MMTNRVLDVILFGIGGNAAQYQRAGWAAPEQGFNWTLGRESAISIPPVDTYDEVYLEFFILPRTRDIGPHAQRMDVAVNGTPLGGGHLPLPSIIAFHVPRHAICGRTLDIVIGHPDNFSDMPGTPDYALALVSLRILARDVGPANPDERISSAKRISPTAKISLSDTLRAVQEEIGVSARELAMAFEVLAGNCEFGGVQRRAGAEPLSLLRFAGASPEIAIRGLDCLFAGIGDELAAYTGDNDIKEWMMRDERYGLHYHTFISSLEVDESEALSRERRKVAFLKRVFLENLASPRKVYVCVDRFGLPDCALLPPFLALERHAPHRMLWVQRAPTPSAAGTAEEIAPRLFRGFVDRFAPPENGDDVSSGSWFELLVNVWRLLRPEPATY